MEVIEEIRNIIDSAWIPSIYEEQIRPLRTRSFEMTVPARENRPVVLHTLLGVELKVGRLRISCPDLSTARYLGVFAAAGCRSVAVPYDITQIPRLADLVEDAWGTMNSAFERVTDGFSPQVKGRIRSALIRAIREEITAIGSGDRMPLFNTSTKQRKD